MMKIIIIKTRKVEVFVNHPLYCLIRYTFLAPAEEKCIR